MPTDGKYFLDTPYKVIGGNIVYASDLNNPFTAISVGFAELVDSIQTGSGLHYAVDTGVVNAYAVSLSPAPTEYEEGLTVWLKPGATSTDAATINVNSLGDVPIRRIGLLSLNAGDLAANYFVCLKYSAGYFQIVSNLGSPDANAAVSEAAALASAVRAELAAGKALNWIDYVEGENLVSGYGYLVDSSSAAITTAFPASPLEGALVGFKDLMKTFDQNSATISRNGSEIEGQEDDIELVEKNVTIIFMYTSSQGWCVVYCTPL